MTIAIGVDLGASNLRLGVVEQEGRVLHSIKEAVDWGQSPADLVAHIAALAQAAPHFTAVSGVGLAIAATVTPAGNIITENANINLPTDYSLTEKLSDRLQLPVYMDNDANLALLGEACFGAARGASDVLMLTLGTGIGGSLMLNGQLRRGKQGIAGEVGLIQQLHPNGSGLAPVESFAAPGALAARLGEPGGHLSEIISRLNGRSKLLLDEMYEQVGLIIVNAHLLLDLECVILGGGYAENGEPLRRGVETAVRRIAPSGMSDHLQIVLGNLPSSVAGVVGAAAYFFEQADRTAWVE